MGHVPEIVGIWSWILQRSRLTICDAGRSGVSDRPLQLAERLADAAHPIRIQLQGRVKQVRDLGRLFGDELGPAGRQVRYEHLKG
jgi:hypothetical protein